MIAGKDAGPLGGTKTPCKSQQQAGSAFPPIHDLYVFIQSKWVQIKSADTVIVQQPTHVFSNRNKFRCQRASLDWKLSENLPEEQYLLLQTLTDSQLSNHAETHFCVCIHENTAIPAQQHLNREKATDNLIFPPFLHLPSCHST